MQGLGQRVWGLKFTLRLLARGLTICVWGLGLASRDSEFKPQHFKFKVGIEAWDQGEAL